METDQMTIPDFPKPSAIVKTPMDLLAYAVTHDAAIDVIERLAALQEHAEDRDAERQFNEAMTRAQAEIGRISPDQQATGGAKQKWASYAKLDFVLRPIYLRHGFSLSFNSGVSPIPETVIVECFVSHVGGHTRKYSAPPMPSDGKGASGGDVMTKTFATGAGMSYGARYLLKFIFNIAVGEDDPEYQATNGEVDAVLKRMEAAREWDYDDFGDEGELGPHSGLKQIFKVAYEQFEADVKALKVIVAAKNKIKKERGW